MASASFSPSDFLYGPILDEGRFGSVVYAELAVCERLSDGDGGEAHQQRSGYAIKMMTKSEVLRCNQTRAVLMEKYILSEVLLSSSSLASSSNQSPPGSELIMKLLSCFHDANYLYSVLELCAGGTLYDLLQSESTTCNQNNLSSVLERSWVQYYSGQILRALEYLHQRGVVHRDLSPKNIVLTLKGEIKLGDFGAAIVFVDNGKSELEQWVPSESTSTPRTVDFVGTADYVSPEMIHGYTNDTTTIIPKQYPAIDLWSFGCLISHMIVGESPFHAASDHLAFQRVIDYEKGEIDLDFTSVHDESAKDLISSLLSKEPLARTGMRDAVFGSCVRANDVDGDNAANSTDPKQYQSIRQHSFFQNGDTSLWSRLENGALEPPYRPPYSKWMQDLDQGRIRLRHLDSIAFDM
jgi:serine/threonine protein kinase